MIVVPPQPSTLVPVTLEPSKELLYVEVKSMIKESEKLGLWLHPNPTFTTRNDTLIALYLSGFKWLDTMIGTKDIYSDASDKLAKINLSSQLIYLDEDFLSRPLDIISELLRLLACVSSASKIVSGDSVIPINQAIKSMLKLVPLESINSDWAIRLTRDFEPKPNPFTKPRLP
jgi:hypothetical protein